MLREALSRLDRKHKLMVPFFDYVARGKGFCSTTLSRLRGLAGRKDRLGYIGWLGHANLGDEALFEAISLLLQPLQLVPYAGGLGESLLQRVGLSGPAYFKAVLVGGGTLISPSFLDTAKAAVSQGCAIHLFGTGAGSSGFGSPSAPDLLGWRELLPHFGLLGVRGPRTLQTLRSLGADKATIIGDPALSLGPDTPQPTAKRPKLVVNLAMESDGVFGKGQYECFTSLTEICRDHVRSGGELIPIALNKHDLLVVQEMLRFASLESLPVHRPSNATEFMASVSGAHCLIGVRLHSAVLACANGIVPILLAYRDKCHDFMESMNLGHLAVDLSEQSGTTIASAYGWVMNNLEYRSVMFQRVQQLRIAQVEYARNIITQNL